MNRRRIMIIFIVTGLLFVTATVFLLTATPVAAQCGSQASSCKNCHETQAKKPVNNDGTAWHTQHAFGDFCYLCHGGNNQSMDEVVSHTGMTPPLADIITSCKGCHAKDFTTKAQVYATTLGQEIGTGGSTATTNANQPTSPASSEATALIPAPTQPAVILSADMVDYSKRYDEVVLGVKPVNVGNIIMIVVLAVIVLGGGFLVLKREGLIKITFEDPKRIPVKEKYPADVVGMLPDINRLKPASRLALHKILANPRAASDLFASINEFSREKSPADESGEDKEK